MYCENCGKKLIRGYQFCLECGTPVPPETEAEDTAAPEEEQYTGPRTEPLDGGEGTLVYCTTCGMHMQTSTTVCEKCGLPLGGGAQQPVQQSSVPLYNSNPSNDLGGGLGGFDGIDDVSGLSDEDINQLDSFVNGYESSISYDIGGTSGGMDSIGESSSLESLDSLTHQLADLSNTYSTMPEIGAENTAPQEATIPAVEEPVYEVPSVDNDVQPEPVVLEKPVELEANPTLVLEDMSLAEDPSKDVESLLMADDPAMVAKSVELTDNAHIDDTQLEINPAYVVGDVSLTDNFDYSSTDIANEPIVDEITEEPAIENPIAEEFNENPVVEESFEETFFDEADEEPIIEETVDASVAISLEKTTDDIIPTDNIYPDDTQADEQSADDITDDLAIGAAAFAASAAIDDEPVIPEYNSYNEPSPDTSYSAASSNTAVATADDDEPEIDLGALIYCRNCGQDMYEKETVCRNCGAPKREAYKPPRVRASQKKEPWKLFGVFGIPHLVGGALIAVAVVALVLTTTTGTTGNQNITGNEQLNANKTTTSAPATTTTPAESEPEITTTPADTTTASTEESTTSQPVESTPEPEVTTTPVETTAPEPEPEQTTPASSATTTTPRSTTTTKPATTTTTKPTTATPPAVAPSDYTPSAAIKAENAQRDAVYNAVELMNAEMGKLNLFANLTIDEIDRYGSVDTVYRRDHIKSMLNSIKSGKSAVDSAVSTAKSKASSLGNASSSLQALHTTYTNFYNYVMSPSGNFISKTSDYTSSYYSGLSKLTHTKLQTSKQSTADKNAYYADIMNKALAAAKNAQSHYKTVQSKFTALPSGSFDTDALDLLRTSSVQSSYLKAAGYAYEVEAYLDILSSAPSAYSSAYTQLTNINDALVSINTEIQYSSYATLSSFKSGTNSALTSLNSAINKLDSLV